MNILAETERRVTPTTILFTSIWKPFFVGDKNRSSFESIRLLSANIPCTTGRIKLYDPVHLWNVHSSGHDVSADQNTTWHKRNKNV